MVGHSVQLFIFRKWSQCSEFSRLTLARAIQEFCFIAIAVLCPKTQTILSHLSAVHGQALTRSTHRHCLLRFQQSPKRNISLKCGCSLICLRGNSMDRNPEQQTSTCEILLFRRIVSSIWADLWGLCVFWSWMFEMSKVDLRDSYQELLTNGLKFSQKQRKEKPQVMPPSPKSRSLTTVPPRLAPTPRTPTTFSESATSSQPSTTLSFTWLISLAVKPTPVSPVVWRLKLIEKNPPLTPLCSPPSTSAENFRLLASTRFTSSSVVRVVLWPRPPAPVPSLLLELLPEMVSRSAELRMLPQPPLIQPEERTVVVEEDSEPSS